MKSMVFVDLDCTLWWNEVIPESALVAISHAVANGHLVLANTGRTRCTAWPKLKDLPLNGQVYAAGAEIWLNGERIFFQPLPVAKIKRLLEKLSNYDIGIATEGSEKLFGNDRSRQRFDAGFKTDDDQKEQAKVAFEYITMPDFSQMKEEDYDDVMKLSLVDVQMETLDSIFEEEDMVFTVFGVQDEDELINGEVTQHAYNKGNAFEIIQNILGKKYRTIALGDSENDITMLDAADLAIAMGNATEETKKHADYITAAVLDDGLYQAFEYAGLLGRAEQE